MESTVALSSATHPKRVMFSHMAEMAKALACASRIEILDLLAQGERRVESIAVSTKLSVANASRHLQQLRRAGLLACRREGTQMLYSLADDQVIAAMRVIRELVERNVAEAAVAFAQLYRRRDPIEPVTREELRKRIKAGAVLVIDVRPALEFASAHIPGAINIPVEHLAERLAELPRNKEIVAYCRGPYCVYAYEALEILRPAGLKARRLLGGFLEWRGAGLPLAHRSTGGSVAAG